MSEKMSLTEFAALVGGKPIPDWQRQILAEFEKHPDERLELTFTRKSGHHYRWVPK